MNVSGSSESLRDMLDTSFASSISTSIPSIQHSPSHLGPMTSSPTGSDELHNSDGVVSTCSEESVAAPCFSPLANCPSSVVSPLCDDEQQHSTFDSDVRAVSPSSGPNNWCGFKIVGDNIDKTVKPRDMRSDRQTKSLHYFHLYAVRDRIDASSLSEEPQLVDPDAPVEELLPTVEDARVMLANFEVLIARVLVQHMPFFSRSFADIVVDHIPHRFSEMMAQKSDVVSIPLQNTHVYFHHFICFAFRFLWELS